MIIDIEQAVKTEVHLQFGLRDGAIFNSVQKQVRRAMIQQVMHETRNNKSAAARALGISRASMRTYIMQLFTESEIKNMGIES